MKKFQICGLGNAIVEKAHRVLREAEELADMAAAAAAPLVGELRMSVIPTIAPFLLPGLLPLPREEGDAVVAEVLWVDRFGNCQLNVDLDQVAAFGPRVLLRWGDDVRTAERAPTYQGIAAGQVGLVVDSYGMLAVCLGRRSAAAELGMPVGTEVTLAAPTDDVPTVPSTPVTFTGRSTP